MSSLKDARSMLYNFEEKTAEVVFPAGSAANIPEITAYFEDASEGKVRTITIYIGEMQIIASRGPHDKWVTLTTNG